MVRLQTAIKFGLLRWCELNLFGNFHDGVPNVFYELNPLGYAHV